MDSAFVGLPTGWSVVSYPSVESTNKTAREIVERGAAKEGLIVWARAQTDGRGRADRSWQSAPGNLYQSCLIRAPSDIADASQVSFVAAVATAGAIAALCPPSDPLCKWPNDVICQGAKVAGILLEMVPRGKVRSGGESWLVLGIGVNLCHAPKTGALYPAGALADFGCGVSAPEALSVLAHSLNAWIHRWRTDGFAPIRAAWLDRALGLGQPVTIRVNAGLSYRGLFQGLDETGYLILDQGLAGPPLTISAGDVFF